MATAFDNVVRDLKVFKEPEEGDLNAVRAWDD